MNSRDRQLAWWHLTMARLIGDTPGGNNHLTAFKNTTGLSTVLDDQYPTGSDFNYLAHQLASMKESSDEC